LDHIVNKWRACVVRIRFVNIHIAWEPMVGITVRAAKIG
jgi:hypothetical protein